MTSPGLKRSISRWEIVGLNLNGVIGSGVYLLPAAAAGLLGPASLWAVPLAGFAVLLLALCFAEAGSHFDGPGAAYLYTREAFGEFVGFEVGWMTWLTRIASGAALWSGLAQALTFFWPEAGQGATRAAVITLPLALVAWINILGARQGALLSVALTVAKVLPLLFLIAIGLPAIDTSLLSPMPAPAAAELGEAALLLLFAYAGFENTAAAAGEYRNPRRDVPFALVTIIGIATVLYTLVQLVALGTLPDLATRTEGSPLADAAVAIAGLGAGLLMAIGAVVSIGGNAANTTVVGPRYLYALAADGYGPRLLAKVHPRYQTPAWAILAQESMVWILAMSGSFMQLALLSIIARLATYIGTAAAVPVLRRKFDPAERTIVLPGGATIPFLALVVCLGFLSSTTVENLLAGLVALAVGVPIYLARREKPASFDTAG